MPATGGFSPGPERYGGGELNSSKPLLQIVFESLAKARGTAYDQTTQSIVGIENLGIARAITYDAWGPPARLANQFIPSSMTADGLLPRWEAIFAVPPLPGDPEPVRRARVAAAWARVGSPNSIQPLIDAMQAALGPLYVGIVHQNLGNALTYINGVSLPIATGTSPPGVSITGSPTGVHGILINITGSGSYGVGTYQILVDGSVVRTSTLSGGVIAITGTGLFVQFVSSPAYTSGDQYAVYTDTGILWASTIAHVDVQVTQSVLGYQNADGSPNAAFYLAVANVNPILDELLPAWATFDWFIASSHGSEGFYLDEVNLDCEAFDV